MLTYMKIQIHSCTDKLTNIKMLMYSLAHEHNHTFISTHQHAYIIACAYIFTHMQCMQTHKHVQTFTHMHAHRFTHIHGRTHIHTFTHR